MAGYMETAEGVVCGGWLGWIFMKVGSGCCLWRLAHCVVWVSVEAGQGRLAECRGWLSVKTGRVPGWLAVEAGKGCCVWRLAECRGCLSMKAGKGCCLWRLAEGECP